MDKLCAKQIHEEALIQYLASPDNPWLTKERLSLEVLGMTDKIYVSKRWKASEFQERIAGPALMLRRGRYASRLSKVDDALLSKAEGGDVQACKLAYERFEGWKPGQTMELSARGSQRADVIITWIGPDGQATGEKTMLESQGQRVERDVGFSYS